MLRLKINKMERVRGAPVALTLDSNNWWAVHQFSCGPPFKLMRHQPVQQVDGAPVTCICSYRRTEHMGGVTLTIEHRPKVARLRRVKE